MKVNMSGNSSKTLEKKRLKNAELGHSEVFKEKNKSYLKITSIYWIFD
jgi:hypothetical protein